MYYLYAIASIDRNYIYVGITHNVIQRFHQHNRGYEKTTKAYKPYLLIYTEEFETRAEARKREIYFKMLQEKLNSEK